MSASIGKLTCHEQLKNLNTKDLINIWRQPYASGLNLLIKGGSFGVPANFGGGAKSEKEILCLRTCRKVSAEMPLHFPSCHTATGEARNNWIYLSSGQIRMEALHRSIQNPRQRKFCNILSHLIGRLHL